uniref:CPBP family intramembrane metalloprotease n=1 Tax=Schlesneria paludicola TaxID=360056 RepID=A0A7C2K0S2_9PLAN
MTGRPPLAGRVLRLARKELQETLRDRRTIATLVLMPLLVYPLLGIVFQKFLVAQFAAQTPLEYHIALESYEAAIRFRDAFSQGNRLLGRELEPGKPLPPPPGEPPEPSLSFLYPEGPATLDIGAAVREGTADLGVRVRPLDDTDHGPVQFTDRGPVQFELITRQHSELSREAREFVEERLHAVNDAFIADWIREMEPDLQLPVTWSPTVVPGEAAAAFSLATLVPLVLILMTVTGAVYPAIDLTAGERERGTLEALIAAPVSRRQVLLAKYVAVMTVALLTAIANLTAMTATAFAAGLEDVLFGQSGFTPVMLLEMLALLVVFAAFFSAVILALTSVARSFKEAQAYLIPLMLLSLAPGILAMLPGLRMTLFLAAVPLANIVLLARDLFDGRFDVPLLVMAIGSTCVYTAVALLVAARFFGTDAVLYGSSGTWSDLWRRPARSQSMASLPQGFLALAGLVPAFLLLGGIPARLTAWPLSARLVASATVTVLLFVAWPMLVAIRNRVDLRSGFGLNGASAWAFGGALLAGLSLWPFAYQLEVWTLSAERLRVLVELFRDLEAELQRIPLAVKLVTLAAVPAVCEELFFRGFLFRACRTQWTAGATIVATAACFGLFHVLVRDALLFERFLPTTLMGLALGWVAHQSGSTLPGMLLHVLHNGLLLSLGTWLNPEQHGWLSEERQSLPAWVLAVAAVGVIAAAALLQRSRAVPTPRPTTVYEPTP